MLEKTLIDIFDDFTKHANSVIVINNLSNFIRQLETRGITLAKLMDIYLAMPNLHIVGTDNPDNYQVVLKGQGNFVQRFKTFILEVNNSDFQDLANLEDNLQAYILTQKSAVSGIAQNMRLTRDDTNRKNKPLNSFLFLGPDETSKLTVAQSLAITIFGNSEKILVLDMFNFTEKQTLGYLIGDQNGTGILTDRMREQPNSLVLLHNLDKATPGIKDLLLQILSEGAFISSRGVTIDMTQCILIAGSNVSDSLISRTSEIIAELPTLKTNILKNIIKHKTFKTELLNSFDDVIIFGPALE